MQPSWKRILIKIGQNDYSDRLLGPGDCLLVTKLDRLARSTRDLLNTLDAISRAGARPSRPTKQISAIISPI
jgi:Resolvase, N terminal domain